MNHPITIAPTDGPLTVYVVAVLFRRHVAADGRQGVGHAPDEVLIAYQFTRPGADPLPMGDAIECGVQHIREQWCAVMGAQSDHRHYGVVRTNTNSTVIRPAAHIAAADPIAPAGAKVRACRVCGCTEDDCSQCIQKTGWPCNWVAADLCSACDPATAPPAGPAKKRAKK